VVELGDSVIGVAPLSKSITRTLSVGSYEQWTWNTRYSIKNSDITVGGVPFDVYMIAHGYDTLELDLQQNISVDSQLNRSVTVKIGLTRQGNPDFSVFDFTNTSNGDSSIVQDCSAITALAYGKQVTNVLTLVRIQFDGQPFDRAEAELPMTLTHTFFGLKHPLVANVSEPIPFV
jgi:hypothetical protein